MSNAIFIAILILSWDTTIMITVAIIIGKNNDSFKG